MEGGKRLVATLGVQGGVIELPVQMSTESGMFDNPFRDGGDLSKDAEVIIDALKTGKLSVMSNTSANGSRLEDLLDISSDGLDSSGGGKDEGPAEQLLVVEKRERKNGEVDIQRGLVVNAKQALVEHVIIPEEKKKQKCKCCVIQ